MIDNQLSSFQRKFEVINDVALAKEILRNPIADTYDFKSYLISIQEKSSRDLGSFITFCESSLVFQSGAIHLLHRRMIKDFFSAKAISKWDQLLTEEISAIIAKVKYCNSFEFLEKVANPIYMVLIRNVFGINVEESEEQKFLSHILRTKDVVEAYVSIKKIEQIQASLSYLKSLVDDSFISGFYNSESLVGLFFENGQIDKSDLIVGLISAAHTTSETLSLIIFNLLDGESGVFLNAADMDWLNLRMDGLLRLFPTTQSIFRYANNDLHVMGITYVKGTIFQLNVETINRNPCFLNEELILNGEMESKCPFNHVSFGGGVHKCPGEELARLTIKIALNKLSLELPKIKLDYGKLELKKTTMINEPKVITILNFGHE